MIERNLIWDYKDKSIKLYLTDKEWKLAELCNFKMSWEINIKGKVKLKSKKGGKE